MTASDLHRILPVIAEVIGRSDRDHPADAVLRAELKRHRGLSPAGAAQVAETVFAYYRWRGWLDAGEPVAKQIATARTLAARFEANAAGFSDAELVSRSVPDWVAREVEISPAWCRALQSKPVLWLRARPGQGSDLAARLGNASPFGTGELRDAIRYFGIQDLFRTREFQAGEFEVQDLSSQVVGLLCRPQPRETWWDACAGEGGKTLHLSDLMRNQGLLWASDRAAWRLKRLKLRAARAKAFNYRTVLWNGGPRPPVKTRFDGVLLDAPCSGLGTWQRNPHARWTTNPDDVRELSVRQGQLLRHVADSVKPGGKLIYSVCTLTRAETTAVADEFSAGRPDFEPLALTNPLKPDDPPLARHWIWPQDNGANGMFVAAWRRTNRAAAKGD